MTRGRGENSEKPSAPRQILKFDPLVNVLDSYEVEYIVIGGFAVSAHGHPRATKDIDICPDPKLSNLRRLSDALEELQAVPIDLEEFEGEFDLKPDFEGLQQGGNWTLMTKYGRLDILQVFSFEDNEEELGEYSDIVGKAVHRKVRGHEFKVCGYDDLLNMKRASGRPVDEIDIQSLKQARRQL